MAVNLGIVGLGRGFMLTLPALRAHPRIKLMGAFDVRAEARERFATEFDCLRYDSLEALLAAPAIDAIYIATPHGLHSEQCIAAAKAGKHVLVEKPMALQLPECDAMIDAAQAAGTVLVVGPSHGFDEPVQEAAKLIATNRFGPLRQITAFNFTDFMYRPRHQVELDPAQGGGVVHNQASHHFDILRRLAGQPVTEVTSLVGSWDANRRGDGAYSAFVRFRSDAAATMTYSGYGHFDSDELMGWISELGHPKDALQHGAARRRLTAMHGDEESRAKLARGFGGEAGTSPDPAAAHEHFGFVLVSCERADLRLMPDGIWIFEDDRRHFLRLPSPSGPRAGVIDELVNAVEGLCPPVQDGIWGRETVLCCEALARSSAMGRAVSIEEIKKDKEK
ncbi:Gfo/Idh/MocA family oxidoreductase [Sphingopyxis sp. LC363]|uniref:Gfo/Idh/MocA family oxidoreductase n=1 Tax=Sphingopyxis sp. LC363 TaxID=1120705 RepID=UPI0005689B86|nr:Gfo/Idh/MocA family oxidoreductase [Sphingopyxis sp. LC363]